jgi:HAD superfamily hydrolase (TIGR01549 family)
MKPATLIFDCDGVVLDSNRVKTEAFRYAALPYGAEAAEALVAFHIANGGISRYRKIEYFLTAIVPKFTHGPGRDELLARFATAVKEGLEKCAVAPCLAELRKKTQGIRWLIVSGGDQAELRTVFARRGLEQMFDGGIFGSPDTKDQILAREIASGNIRTPALFLGDSKYDLRAAQNAGIEFVFVSKWTELEDWRQFISYSRIPAIHELGQLMQFFNKGKSKKQALIHNQENL